MSVILMPLLNSSQLRKRWKTPAGLTMARVAEDILRGHVKKADWDSRLAQLEGRDEVAKALDLRGIELPSLISVSGVDLTEARFDYASINWSFGGSVLDRAKFDGAEGKNVDFGGCSLVQSSFVDAKFPGAVFYGANLQDADLTGIAMRGGQLKEAVCRNAKFTRADLRTVWAADSDLRGVDFQKANLIGASLGGATWDLTSRFDSAQLTHEGTPSDLLAYAITQGASVQSEKPEWELSLMDATVQALQAEDPDEGIRRIIARLGEIRHEVERNPRLMWANVLRPEVDDVHWAIFQQAVRKAANNIGALLG